MKVSIRPSHLKGTVRAPASKSMAHRLLIAAALCSGTSVMKGIEAGDDVEATLDCLTRIGAEAVTGEDGTLFIRNNGLHLPESGIFPLRESGSTFRFLIPVTLMIGGEARFQGSQRLWERGVRVYEELFSPKGISMEWISGEEAGDEPVLRVRGRLEAGSFRLPGGFSSQYISGLLLALPMLPGDSEIEIVPPVESRPYIELTMDVLRRFGVFTEWTDDHTIRIPGGQNYEAVSCTCEGDWSNGAVLLSLRSLGHSTAVEGLDPHSVQGDRTFLSFEKKLREESFPELDLGQTPDLGPVLFALASAKNGAVFTGVERLRMKESDRLSAMAEELVKFGVEMETHEHSVVIYPSSLHEPKEALLAHNDHRVVMAEALLATVYGGVIEGAEAVRKSYPGFFDDLLSLGAEIQTFGSSAKDL